MDLENGKENNSTMDEVLSRKQTRPVPLSKHCLPKNHASEPKGENDEKPTQGDENASRSSSSTDRSSECLNSLTKEVNTTSEEFMKSYRDEITKRIWYAHAFDDSYEEKDELEGDKAKIHWKQLIKKVQKNAGAISNSRWQVLKTIHLNFLFMEYLTIDLKIKLNESEMKDIYAWIGKNTSADYADFFKYAIEKGMKNFKCKDFIKKAEKYISHQKVEIGNIPNYILLAEELSNFPTAFHCCHVNTQSLKAREGEKFKDFKAIFQMDMAQCIAVSETWLTDEQKTADFDLPGFVMHRQDRTRGFREIGGGVAIYVRELDNSNPKGEELFARSLNTNECGIDFLAVKVEWNNCDLVIAAVYIPTKHPNQNIEAGQLMTNNVNKLEEWLNEMYQTKNYKPSIMIGDFNAKYSQKYVQDVSTMGHIFGLTEKGFGNTLCLVHENFDVVNAGNIPARELSRDHDLVFVSVIKALPELLIQCCID